MIQFKTEDMRDLHPNMLGRVHGENLPRDPWEGCDEILPHTIWDKSPTQIQIWNNQIRIRLQVE
jgi:hypothetical protein